MDGDEKRVDGYAVVATELGLGMRLGDVQTNKLRLNYSVACCNIRRSAHPQSAFYP